MTGIFCLRVDVDTRRGMIEGVPRLMRMLTEKRVKATFFIPMGPDRTGMNITNLHSLLKAFKVNPIRKYGLKNMLNGLLYRNIQIPEWNLISSLIKEGFEIGIHGYDHYKWAKNIDKMSIEEVRVEVEKALRIAENHGLKVKGFASPSFKVTETSLKVIAGLGFKYSSDHYLNPVKPYLLGRLVQIPVNIPLIEDLHVKGYRDDSIYEILVNKISETVDKAEVAVLCIHACYEPIVKEKLLSRLLDFISDRYETITLSELADKILGFK